MQYPEMEQWSRSLDIAEQQPITQELPDSPIGTLFDQPTDSEGMRRWLRVEIVSGNTGGRWAYWASWKDSMGRPGIGPHPRHQVIADAIFNGDAPHFLGMLGVPYAKSPGTSLAWVLVEPRIIPKRPVYIPEEKANPRYEKSKEVFNVDDQTTTEIP